ncbi:MAG: LysR family transcriptional regulator [Eubacteriales bacterium]
MEIRQLECFVAAVEQKTFIKASEVLFVTQPAVSKAIAQLEKDVKTKLFERSSKGLRLTHQGENLYVYAKNILEQVELMHNATTTQRGNRLCVASYPSYSISDIISDFYCENQDMERLDFREGEMQDIIDWVYTGIAEIGILYISSNRVEEFVHILSHKNLEFVSLTKKHFTLYIGDAHPLHSKPTPHPLSEKQLNSFKYIRGIHEFFSVEHHVEHTDLTPAGFTGFRDEVVTNSDHLTMLLMKKTDLCWMGIDSTPANVNSKCPISSNKAQLLLGYIKRKSTLLGDLTLDFIQSLEKRL